MSAFERYRRWVSRRLFLGSTVVTLFRPEELQIY